MEPVRGFHALETALLTPANPIGHPSLAAWRLKWPRQDDGTPLPYRWRLHRSRDFPPVAAPVVYGLAVVGGWIVDATDVDSEAFTLQPFPFMRDPARQCDGQTVYDFQAFLGSQLNSWDVVDGVLCTAMALTPRSGPFSVRQKPSGDYAISCSHCGWRGRGKRTAQVMPHRLIGDVARHDCTR